MAVIGGDGQSREAAADGTEAEARAVVLLDEAQPRLAGRVAFDPGMNPSIADGHAGQADCPAAIRRVGVEEQRHLMVAIIRVIATTIKATYPLSVEVKLRPLIKGVLENQQLTLIAQRVRLDVKIEDLSPQADRGKLRLILDNLLSNAIKFTPRGGTIAIHALSEREQLIIDVIDSGPGIPVDERNRIFEAFYQGKTPQGGHVKGTGIGLSVVTEFVNAHGGGI